MPKRNSKANEPTEIPDSAIAHALANNQAIGAEEPELEKVREASIRGVDHYAVARRAHEIWEAEGCPRGRSEDHWYQAERELLDRSVRPGSWAERSDSH